MPGFWAHIWISPWRATLAGVLLSAAIASILYGFNWHTFYDTRGYQLAKQAEEIARDLRQLAEVTGAGPGRDQAFRSAIGPYLAGRRSRLTVTRGSGAAPIWSESNDAPLEARQTHIDKTLELAGGERSDERLTLRFERDVRPSLTTALLRAWSFSIGDFRRDPERWRSHRYINRSIPLYGYLLTIMAVGFGTIRALHRDQRRLAELHDEATQVAGELERLRQQRAQEARQLRSKLDESESLRGEAILERQRLEEEIKGVEEEYGLLRDGESAPSELKDERLRAIAEAKGAHRARAGHPRREDGALRGRARHGAR